MSEFIRKEFLRFIYQFIINEKYVTAEKLIDFLVKNDNDICLVNWYLEFKELLYGRPLIICQRIRDYLK